MSWFKRHEPEPVQLLPDLRDRLTLDEVLDLQRKLWEMDAVRRSAMEKLDIQPFGALGQCCPKCESLSISRLYGTTTGGEARVAFDAHISRWAAPSIDLPPGWEQAPGPGLAYDTQTQSEGVLTVRCKDCGAKVGLEWPADHGQERMGA